MNKRTAPPVTPVIVYPAEMLEKYPHLKDPRAKPPWQTRYGKTPPFPVTHPHLVAEYVDEANMWTVTASANGKYKWRCGACGDEWFARMAGRSQGKGCQRCAMSGHRELCRAKMAGRANGKLLTETYPSVASQWHPTKNSLDLSTVWAGSSYKAWWQCAKGHEWQSVVYARVKQKFPCPVCRGKRASSTCNLAANHPDLATEWSAKNIRPASDYTSGSHEKVWWACDRGHEYQAPIRHRVRGLGCCQCHGRVATPDRNLAICNPKLAAEWHPTKNDRPASAYTPKSSRSVWWRCADGHEWQSKILSRVYGNNCPGCRGWGAVAIRAVLASLRDRLHVMTPSELYLFCQQSGMLAATNKGRRLIRNLAMGQLPLSEVDKFISGEPSSLDLMLENSSGEEDDIVAPETVDGKLDIQLPIVTTKDILRSGMPGVSDMDEQAIEFLISSRVDRIWKHAFVDPERASQQAAEFAGDEFGSRVAKRFLDEAKQVHDLRTPRGYAFRHRPNLMQKLIAVRVRDRLRVGNWSGTGSGKTLSAVLASRICGAGMTLIVCPNATVEGWHDKILEYFPDSAVACKVWAPEWPVKLRHRYLVLNYEMFQQSGTDSDMRALLGMGVDFVILDEVHFAKVREDVTTSLRRWNIQNLLTEATERNPGLRVLSMSATPVINELTEAKSLIELTTGKATTMETRATVPNCMAVYRQMAMLGLRYMPQYDMEFEQVPISVECSEFIEEIRQLGRIGRGSHLQLEQVLTRARLPIILANLKPKTLIYTHLVGGIVDELKSAIESDGWTVGLYTGEDKAGLEAFLSGGVDVLIGSSAISTGVDRLQEVCNHLIVNVLPWTHAEFEQLKGRLYRQGQRHRVTAIIPLTYAEVGEIRWSWCESKMARLRFKKTIADSAVDGVVPEKHLVTPEQAYEGLMAWLERLDEKKAA